MQNLDYNNITIQFLKFLAHDILFKVPPLFCNNPSLL
jgi:hypothetical protein